MNEALKALISAKIQGKLEIVEMVSLIDEKRLKEIIKNNDMDKIEEIKLRALL